MENLFIFDIYTAKVFGFIFASILAVIAIIIFSIKFPAAMSLLGKLIMPVYIILIAGFFGFQVAKMNRQIDKWSQHD